MSGRRAAVVETYGMAHFVREGAHAVGATVGIAAAAHTRGREAIVHQGVHCQLVGSVGESLDQIAVNPTTPRPKVLFWVRIAGVTAIVPSPGGVRHGGQGRFVHRIEGLQVVDVHVHLGLGGRTGCPTGGECGQSAPGP